MRGIRVAALTGAMVFASAGWALSGQVTLGALDGSLEISGELVDFDGEYFRLETIFGPLTVAVAAVTCTGAACPVDGAFVPEFAVSVEDPLDASLLEHLLRDFARARGLAVRGADGEAGDRVFELSGPDGAAPVLRFVVALPGDRAPQEDAALIRGRASGDDGAGARLVGLDAVVIALHPEAPVTGLTAAQAKAVLTGEATNWSDLGGPDRPLVLHLPRSDAIILEALGLAANPGPSDRAIRHAEPLDVGRVAAMASNAVGFTLLSRIGPAVASPLIGSCGAVARADASSVKSRDYPFVLPLFLRVSGRARGIVGEFLGFIEGSGAQEALRASGHIDLSPEATPLSHQGDRLARAILATEDQVPPATLRRLVRFLDGAERLSPTFRFRDGSSDLDAASFANVALVARLAGAGTLDGAVLKIAGFSDGMGGAAANLALSRERAETVRLALREALPERARGRVTIEAEGFGEAMAIACDEDDWGRHVNRRVEFWLQR